MLGGLSSTVLAGSAPPRKSGVTTSKVAVILLPVTSSPQKDRQKHNVKRTVFLQIPTGPKSTAENAVDCLRLDDSGETQSNGNQLVFNRFYQNPRPD